MMLIGLLIAIVCSEALVESSVFSADPAKLPDIDYIGLGYDVILGNPHTNMRDPGYKEAVVQLEYKTQSTTSDGRWLVPDNIQALQVVACNYQIESTEIKGMNSYQNSLSADASFDMSTWRAKFSASLEYKQVSEGIARSHMRYVESVAKCSEYRVTVRSAGFNVTSDFSAAILALPSFKNDTAFFKLLSIYGTHYASAITMGAKAVVRSKFTQEAVTRMEQNNLNIHASAQASFYGITGKLSASTELENKMRQEFESSRSSYEAAYLGSNPSSDGKWETWALSTSLAPYPIEYSLRPLSDLVDAKYIKTGNSASQLSIKRQLLIDAYTRYCASVPGCNPPEVDQTYVRMDTNITGGSQVVSCRPGYSLLSCGYGNLPNRQAETRRYASPYGTNSCECYSTSGMICFPWCSNAVKGLEVRSISCPTGKKVIGCDIKPTTTSGENWRKFYPHPDGTSCICQSFYNVYCGATCASNIADYEIRTQYNTGVIYAICSPGNYVLGCGIAPVQGSTDTFRNVFVESSADRCQCYDKYGATCYAICGKLT